MADHFNGSISYGLYFAVALVCAINQIVILGGIGIITLLLGGKKK